MMDDSFAIVIQHDRSYALCGLSPSVLIEVVMHKLEEELLVSDATLQRDGKVLNPSRNSTSAGLARTPSCSS